VHGKNGPWAASGGYEYNVVLAAAAMTIAESGPGALSLDHLRGKERQGWLWGLFSLALGAVGAAGAHVLAESRATPAVATPVPANAPAGPEAPESTTAHTPSANGVEIVLEVEEEAIIEPGD
jgi:putative oxidoreductase